MAYYVDTSALVKRYARENWTAWERAVMAESRWWSVDDLAATPEVVFPEDLAEILAGIVGESPS